MRNALIVSAILTLSACGTTKPPETPAVSDAEVILRQLCPTHAPGVDSGRNTEDCDKVWMELAGPQLPGGVYLAGGPTVRSWGKPDYTDAPRFSSERYCFGADESFPFVAVNTLPAVTWNVSGKDGILVPEQYPGWGAECNTVVDEVNVTAERCGEPGTPGCYLQHPVATDAAAPRKMVASGTYTSKSKYTVRQGGSTTSPPTSYAYIIVRPVSATAPFADIRVETWCFDKTYYWAKQGEQNGRQGEKIVDAETEMAMITSTPPAVTQPAPGSLLSPAGADCLGAFHADHPAPFDYSLTYNVTKREF